MPPPPRIWHFKSTFITSRVCTLSAISKSFHFTSTSSVHQHSTPSYFIMSAQFDKTTHANDAFLSRAKYLLKEYIDATALDPMSERCIICSQDIHNALTKFMSEIYTHLGSLYRRTFDADSLTTLSRNLEACDDNSLSLKPN